MACKTVSAFTTDNVTRWAMFEKHTIVGATIFCSLAGLFSASLNITANAAECLAAPNAQSRPGTHWYYRIDQATQQRCWYLKDEPSRPLPASEIPTGSGRPRAGSEPASSPASTESESSITAWFSSKLAALTGAAKPSPTAETGEPST